MLRQVVRRLRFAVIRKVGRRGAGDDVDLGHAPRHQPGLLQAADPHRDVHALRDQVDDAVVEADVEVDRRVATGEVWQGRQQQVAAERDRHVHPQQSLWLGARAAQGLLGILDFVQDAAAAAQEVGTLGGQADSARGAVEQADPEVLLERRDVSAGRGPGNVQFVSRLPERAALGDPGEHAHGQQLVHRAIVPLQRTGRKNYQTSWNNRPATDLQALCE